MRRYTQSYLEKGKILSAFIIKDETFVKMIDSHTGKIVVRSTRTHLRAKEHEYGS